MHYATEIWIKFTLINIKWDISTMLLRSEVKFLTYIINDART